jgi:hypothetical protein
MSLCARDMLRDLVLFIHGQSTAANVVEFVWLGPAALQELDGNVRQLSEAEPAETVPTFDHGAYVLPDGWLLVALVTERGGFCFRVPPGDWGWARRPA